MKMLIKPSAEPAAMWAAEFAKLMPELALLHVLRHHRQARAFAAQQRDRKWAKLPLTEPSDCRVGVMGMGAIGAAAAQAIQRVGFDVAGWSRSPKHLDGITSFA